MHNGVLHCPFLDSIFRPMFITEVATIVFDIHFSIHLFLHAVYAFVNSVRIT